MLGEQLYFWNLKKLILDLRAKPLTDQAQLYYLCLIILISPIISLISNLDELWGIEWYFALAWVAKFCAILGMSACYWSSKTRNKSKQDVPNSFLSCLISISWVIGFRFCFMFCLGFGLLVFLDNFNLQWFNCDYLVWCLNSWVNTPYYLILGIIILNLIFFGLVSRAIVQVVK
jgi:hypothetical protein